MKEFLCFIMIATSSQLIAQNSAGITLKWCNQRAVEKYPLQAQVEYLDNNTKLRLKNLDVNYYPQLSVNGQFSYQSEVTQIDMDNPFVKIVPPDKNQYKMSFDIGQLIYDGGVTGSMRKLEKKELEYQQKSLEAELYKLKEKVSNCFFSILQLQLNADIFHNSLDDLNSRLESIKSAIKNGVMLETNSMILEAEIYKLNQQLAENEILLASQWNVLNGYLDTTISSNTKLNIPEEITSGQEEKNFRLENDVFRIQGERLDLNKNLLDKRHYPKLSAFGQLGYGKPGLNMLSNEFDSFYMFGVKMNWNFWNWNQTGREKKSLDIQKKLIDAQQNTFNFTLELARERQMAEILRLRELLKTDEKLISIRGNISKVMGSQLENGVITASQFITEKNNEINAYLNKTQHDIMLGKAYTDYAILLGIL